jgi:hypothetical protein
MQFLMTVSIVQATGEPPAAFQAAMTAFVDDETRAGTFVTSGAFAPAGGGVGLRTGPGGRGRTEVQVPIHGFAIVQCGSFAQAEEVASRWLRLHEEFAPSWEVACDVREIVTRCLP